MKYKAAIDASGNEVALAVSESESGKVLIEEFYTVPRRNSSTILKWMLGKLADAAINLKDIESWSVGRGPGSFTGLRQINALISGLTFGREDSQLRGVPTAIGLAAQVSSKPGDKIATLYDGRRQETLLVEIENRDGVLSYSGKNEVLLPETKERELKTKYDHYIALERDREAISSSLDPELVSIVKFTEKIDITSFLDLPWLSDSSTISEPIYIRPAVFVQPRVIREV